VGRAWKRVGDGSVGVYIALFVLAFALRAGTGAALLSRGPADFVLASDDGDAYDAAARAQAFGVPVVFTPRMAAKWSPDIAALDRWPQGYWLFLAAQYAVFGSAYVSTLVLQALAGACGVLAGFALARAVLSERWAVLAAVALAVSSTGIFLASALYAESLYIPLVLVALALAVRGLQARPWVWFTLAGVAFGCAEATRPLALPILAAVFAWCLLPTGDAAARQRLRAALGLSAGFALGVAPFVAHDLAVLGRVATFTVGGVEALGDLRSGSGSGLPERLDLLFVSGGWGPLGEPFVSLLGAAAAPVRFGEALIGMLGLAWLVRPGARTRSVGWLLLLACAAILIAPLFFGLPLVRYRAVADPLLIVGLVAAIEATWRAVRRPRLHLRPQRA
jgi:hypothetical protein